MGGTITRSALADFVVNETAAKRWLHHPGAAWAVDLLNAQLDEEGAQQDELRLAIESVAYDNPPETWGALFLEAATLMFQARQASRQLQSADADRHEEELRAAAIALACHGYPEAGDPGLYGAPAMLLERLLSIRDDTGVGYAEGSCWEVISSIRQDGTGVRQWHPVYLMAIRVYAPTLTALQKLSIAKWRDEVADSVRLGYDMYVRDGRYDRLLALLFPEMAERLRMPQRAPARTAAAPSIPVSAPASRPPQPLSWGWHDLEKLRPGVDYDPHTYALRGGGAGTVEARQPGNGQILVPRRGRDDVTADRRPIPSAPGHRARQRDAAAAACAAEPGRRRQPHPPACRDRNAFRPCRSARRPPSRQVGTRDL
jgi:hypothetical protein